MAGAFISGTGDYVALFEPTASSVEAEGAGFIVASVGAESGEIPYTAYFAQKSFIEKNEELIQSFTNAIAKGLTWVQEHTAAEVAKVIQPSFPDTDLQTLETVVQNYKISTPGALRGYEGGILPKRDRDAGGRGIGKAAPFSELVNNSFAENTKN